MGGTNQSSSLTEAVDMTIQALSLVEETNASIADLILLQLLKASKCSRLQMII